MRNGWMVATITLAVALLFGGHVARSDAAATRIGYVDVQRVIVRSVAGVAAREQLEKDKAGKDEVLAKCREYCVELEAFLREHDLVTMPEKIELKVELTPEFNRGVPGASCDPPGPLEAHLPTFFYVTPIPDTWTPEQAGMWGLRLVGLKHRVTNAVFRIVDLAVELAGGFGVNRKSEIERLFRDARMGRIHPANFALVHELTAKGLLGLDLDDPQRWG